MSLKQKRILGILFGVCGFGLLSSVFAPIFSYELFDASRNEGYLSPLPENYVDYKNYKNWFQTASSSENMDQNAVRYYNLSIEKLGISEAVVTIGGEDLSDSLIQYPGTALPGKTGNTVVFGHSVLPIFYNPKVYLTIFSKLPNLTKKDQFEVSYDGIAYKYEVQDKFEVLPTNLEVLSQDFAESYISLITCVPPGDPRRPRRLVVRAKLIPYEKSTYNVN